VPIVLRLVGDHYELIGDAYIDGIMGGEVMDAFDRRELELQNFVLY
jgi:hypothetical protein